MSQKSNANKSKPNVNAPIYLGGGIFGILVVYAIVGSINNCSSVPSTGISHQLAQSISTLPAKVNYGGKTIPGKAFVGMEATRTVQNPELISEIQKVIDSGGLPSEVFQQTIPDEENIASTLSKTFSSYNENPIERQRLEREVSKNPWGISPKSLEKVNDILPGINQKRDAIRSMLVKPESAFDFQFIENTELGEMPNAEAADFLNDYLLVEEYTMAQALNSDKIGEAIDVLKFVFRLAQLASEIKNTGVRQQVAQIRLHALDMMQAVLLHPKLRRSDLVSLYNMMQEQLDHWSPDTTSWIGERASGLKTYNILLQFGPDLALESDEIDELKERSIYDSLTKTLSKTFASDQSFYLKSMQQIIDSCAKPYFKRRETLDQINQSFNVSPGNEALIADLLLRDIDAVMLECALDRAACEAMTLGMSKSLNLPVTTTIRPKATLSTNPLSGHPYDVSSISGEKDQPQKKIRVTFSNENAPFLIPDFSTN
ncbi:MAG: hypothetical protein ACRCUY_08155 [Thermoguttaceae bacterium]